MKFSKTLRHLFANLLITGVALSTKSFAMAPPPSGDPEVLSATPASSTAIVNKPISFSIVVENKPGMGAATNQTLVLFNNLSTAPNAYTQDDPQTTPHVFATLPSIASGQKTTVNVTTTYTQAGDKQSWILIENKSRSQVEVFGPIKLATVGTPPSITTPNLSQNKTLETGFLVGTSTSGTGVTNVGVRALFDGTQQVMAQGTSNWKVSLPRWRTGSKHTVQIQTLDGDGNVLSQSSLFRVSRGLNKDVNGDGYADLIVWGGSTGGAYVFFGNAAGTFPSTPSLTIPAPSSNDSDSGAGTAVFAGDLNGDGYGDIVIGETQIADMGTIQASIFLGNSNPQAMLTPVAALSGPSFGPTFGRTPSYGNAAGSLAGVGDINGDGYGDLIIGCGTYVCSGVNLYYGAPTLSSGMQPHVLTAPIATQGTYPESFGTVVGYVGDLNGDGYADIFVGAPYDVVVGENCFSGTTPASECLTFGGTAYLFSGTPQGIMSSSAGATPYKYLVASLKPTTTAPSIPYGLGYSFAVGDFDGDGKLDIAVGSPLNDLASANFTGAVYLFSDVGNSLTRQVANAVLESPQPFIEFGDQLIAGDFNGDGISDLAVTTQNGDVYVYHSKAGALQTTPEVIIPYISGYPPLFAGTSVAVKRLGQNTFDSLFVEYSPYNAYGYGNNATGEIGIFTGAPLNTPNTALSPSITINVSLPTGNGTPGSVQ